jgi:alkylation response protein AidB-like acyl-CoA dehydrogenase
MANEGTTFTPETTSDTGHLARLAALQELLGDPEDDDNPVGNRAVLHADEREEVLHVGERLLEQFGLNAEFVPIPLGGRFSQVDQMIRLVRAVSRRDQALALGFAGTVLIASSNVWTAGNQSQQKWVADLLLSNGRIAAAYHELAHGGDFLSTELTATRDGDQFVLTGRKEVISNAARADAVVAFARTGSRPGARSHSQILVDMRTRVGGDVGHLPRFRSAGMRGVQLGGLDFQDWRVPADHLLGRAGDGLSTATRAFQITRTALPSLAAGGLDTALRTAVTFAQQRRLGARAVADLPYARANIVNAFVDLLICDAFSTVAARALHLLPKQTTLFSSAVKYLVPQLLLSAMRRLSTLLGASFYVRDGRFGIFQKHLRDLAPAAFAHIAPAACLAAIVPQLSSIARRSWAQPESADPLLFRLNAGLPALPFDQLVRSANGRDHLSSTLLADRESLMTAAGGEPELRDAINWWSAELEAIREDCDRHSVAGGGFPTTAAYDLAARYARLLAASACINVWRYADPTDTFMSEPTWVNAALIRLASGRLESGTTTAHVERLWPELLRRHTGRRTFDIYGSAL